MVFDTMSHHVNLIISNPKGSSNVKLGVKLEICTRKQEPKDSRNTS